MKISEQWLREWVNPSVDSDTLAEQLTMAGLEIDDTSPVARPFNDVLVGEVIEVTQHPDADRLRVTKVNIGTDTPLQIVCGAPNVHMGMKAPVATIGAVLPNGLKIKKSKLRGVESQGMLCGASEIDLVDKIDGLLELPSEAPVGANIRDYLQLDARIIDVSITPNRGDCFSVRGLAREMAVLNDLPFNEPVINKASVNKDLELKINAQTNDCPRYFAQHISNIDNTALTPDWMVRHLERSGLAVKSLLVDVTNYVMMALGQPLHAFDADKIQGDIQIRYAHTDEKLTLLTEQEVTLTDDVLVIADDGGAIAIAGIMGGLSTAVTDATTNVLIESAHFAQLAIAGRARRFGLHTDASQRFERGVDFELPEKALDLAISLIHQYAGGEVSKIIKHDNDASLPPRNHINLTSEQIKDRLGFDIPVADVTRILNSLSIKTGVATDDTGTQWSCIAPSHRFDIAIPVDLIEELVRIYGYDQIPATMPQYRMQMKPQAEATSVADITQLLANLGYQEAISFSFSDEKIESLLNPDAVRLALANPISADLAVMRSTLLSSLLPCVSHNVNRKQSRVHLFETGLRFNGKAIDELEQIPTLAMVMTGAKQQETWHDKNRDVDFYDLKQHVMQLFSLAKVDCVIRKSSLYWLHPGQSADIFTNHQADKPIGYFGALHPNISNALDLPTTWVAEINIEALTQAKVFDIQPLAKFPQVRRDIAFFVDANIAVADLLATIKQTAGSLSEKALADIKLTDAWVFDVYQGEHVPAGQRSIAFALIWQDYHKTLADEDTLSATSSVIDALTEQYGATLRSQN